MSVTNFATCTVKSVRLVNLVIKKRPASYASKPTESCETMVSSRPSDEVPVVRMGVPVVKTENAVKGVNAMVKVVPKVAAARREVERETRRMEDVADRHEPAVESVARGKTDARLEARVVVAQRAINNNKPRFVRR